ncbi:MAG TPA: four helix bundle protein [Chthoniobacter sp.]|nr:four helix bundle protein [Chthoniobacter sp.]
MNKEELKLRTKQFALRTIKLVRSLPKDVPGKVLTNQRMRSATSVGANYRSACRGRSKAEWRAKLGICLEEVDESAYWLELMIEDEMLPRPRVEPLWKEADELCAIFYAALETGKSPS